MLKSDDQATLNSDQAIPTIYWDHCASTPVSPTVIKQMTRSLTTHHANPSSAHPWGYAVREEIENARDQLARLLKVQAREIFFTSGATEANNIAILSGLKRVGLHHVITQKTEHSAVLKPIKTLVEQGCTATVLNVDRKGYIDLDQLKNEINADTRLVSLMHINNEIGTMQAIAEIAELIAKHAHPECLFHVDGAQSAGKIPIDLKALNIDLFSLSAHKFYGPKGVGALYVNRKSPRRSQALKLPPLFLGGQHERGLRPGTLASHQIIGLGQAAQEAKEALKTLEDQRLHTLVNELYQGLKGLDPSACRQGGGEAPHVLSITVSKPTLSAIEEAWGHIAFSRGSACQSSSGKASHVLTALGLTSEEASRTLRFGLGRDNHLREVQENLKLLKSYLP